MKKVYLFKIALMILIMLIAFTNLSVCFAEDAVPDNFKFDEFDAKNADASLVDPVKDATGTVLSAIRIVGTGVSLIMLAVVGMKYMLASPSDRADIKKTAIQYVVGAVIVFGAVNILDILVAAFSEFFE